jgi:hypothetical protein
MTKNISSDNEARYSKLKHQFQEVHFAEVEAAE